MPNLSISDWVGILGGGAGGLIAVYRGWERYTTGVMPETGPEFWQALDYVNLLNHVLLRPRQERLTERQIRGAGLVYMTLGGLVLAIVSLVALGILH